MVAMEKASSIQKALVIIKPDAVNFHCAVIREILIRQGYTIVKEEKICINRDRAGEFYTKHKNDANYLAMVAHLSSGPSHVMVVAKANAIADLTELVQELQEHGTDGIADAVYVSTSTQDAKHEVKFFYPQVSVDQIPTDREAQAFVQERLKPTLVQALTNLCKEKPEQPTKWLANYLLANNPNKPKIGC